MAIIFGSMNVTAPEPDDFASRQRSDDRSRWVGYGWTGTLPGGGNTPPEGSGPTIKGPKGPLEGSNS